MNKGDLLRCLGILTYVDNTEKVKKLVRREK